MRPIITLTTDFGLRDPYVAEMKAVILSICPEANIVDISHEIEKFNIRMAAFILACATPYFPKGAIHVVVVDPGVGTEREPILIRTKRAYYIGPDNGVFSLATKNDKPTQTLEITNKILMMPQISNTFHGRDIFAPTAAHLANKTSLDKIGRKIRKMVTPSFAKIVKEKGELTGEVVYIDDFGNVVTNIDMKCLKLAKNDGAFVLRMKGRKLRLKILDNYAGIQRDQIVGLIGGHGFLEISMNRENAAKHLGVRTGDEIMLFSATEKEQPVSS